MPVRGIADGKPSPSRHPQDSITTAPPRQSPWRNFLPTDRQTPAHPVDRKSHPGNSPDHPETVATATASEGTQRELAQNRIQHVPGVGQPGVVPAAPRATGTIGIGDCRYLFFFLNFVFRCVLVCVFGLLFRIFGHFLHQTCEVARPTRSPF